MKKLLKGLLFFILLISPTLVYAEKEIIGEIINVNYRYKTAFSDLTPPSIQPGDIVELYSDGIFIAYLKVSETSTAISKLIPIKGSHPYKTNVDFKNIKIGQQIKVVLPGEVDLKGGSATYEDPSEKAPYAQMAPQVKNPEDLFFSPSEDYLKLKEEYSQLNVKYSSSLENVEFLQKKIKEQSEEIHELRQALELYIRKNETLNTKNLELKDKISDEKSIKEKKINDNCQKELNAMTDRMSGLKEKLSNILTTIKRKTGNL